MTSEAKIVVLKEKDIPEALIKLRSDGIIHVHYKKNVTIDIETREMMREIYRELAPGKKLNYIFSADNGVTFTKEARENSNEANSPIASYAIIANNLAYRLVANFYLKVTKPAVPYRIFSSVKEAVAWLHSQPANLPGNLSR